MSKTLKYTLKKERQKNKRSTKTIIQTIVWVLVFGLLVYGVFWVVTLPKFPQSEIISNNGLHIHSTLSIIVNGKKIGIPADVGIGATYHSPMHTHKTDGVIHMEYSGVVKSKDLILGKFFDIWGKKFNKNSFMGNSLKDGVVKMTVNGKENTEFKNYSMKDGDIIDIVYNKKK